jgi:uncharacterized MnhB-related membrane protein
VERAFDVVLIFLLLTSALVVIRTKDLLAAAIIFSTYSLMMCVLWQLRGAPDVALTEAAVGAGVTTVLFLVTISRTVRRER